MHNIKEIRKDFDAFSKALKKRSIDIDLNKLKKLDIDNRDLIQKKETLEKEKKDISKTKDKALFSRSKEITQSIDKITDQQSKIKSDLDEILSSIPNIPHDDVPVGSNENENVELTKSGQIPNFEFTPKSHFELGEKLGMLDFDLATKTSGSRFVHTHSYYMPTFTRKSNSPVSTAAAILPSTASSTATATTSSGTYASTTTSTTQTTTSTTTSSSGFSSSSGGGY